MTNTIEKMENDIRNAKTFMDLWRKRTEDARMNDNKEYNIRYVLDFEGTKIIATNYNIRIGSDGAFVNLYFHKHFIGQMLLKNVQTIL